MNACGYDIAKECGYDLAYTAGQGNHAGYNRWEGDICLHLAVDMRHGSLVARVSMHVGVVEIRSMEMAFPHDKFYVWESDVLRRHPDYTYNRHKIRAAALEEQVGLL